MRHEDVVIERRGDGTVTANVEHLPAHSPTGFEVGYSGSGPSDLGLAILNAFVPIDYEGYRAWQARMGAFDEKGEWTAADHAEFEQLLRRESDTDPAKVRAGLEVSRFAWFYHHEFTREVLAPLHVPAGGRAVLSAATIKTWIRTQRVHLVKE